MTQNNTLPPTGFTAFTSEDSSFMRYLDALRDDSQEARDLQDHTQDIILTALHLEPSDGELGPEYDFTAAKILDLDHDNQVHASGALRLSELASTTDSGPLNEFLQTFTKAKDNTHTRIVILQGYGDEIELFDELDIIQGVERRTSHSSQLRKAVSANLLRCLLFVHILVVELNMKFSELYTMLSRKRSSSIARDILDCPALETLRTNVLRLGYWQEGQPSMCCCPIGPRLLQGNQVEHG